MFCAGKNYYTPKAIILQHGNMLKMAKPISQFKILCVCVCARVRACAAAAVLMETPVADSQQHSNETSSSIKRWELSSLTMSMRLLAPQERLCSLALVILMETKYSELNVGD